jgi:hypothetical protein
MKTAILEHARRLWDYQSAPRQRAAADLIVVCCSYDLRVGDYAGELLATGLAGRILYSGNTGNWTRQLWNRPEAHVFRERALGRGVAADAIVIEDRATNFGENIAYARALAPAAGTVIFLTKPNSVLRVSLTVPLRWPGITAFVDAPPLAFPDEVADTIGVDGVIHEMVGDIERIIEYPKRGFQVAHELPTDVLESWHFLIRAGFTHHRLGAGTNVQNPGAVL